MFADASLPIFLLSPNDMKNYTLNEIMCYYIHIVMMAKYQASSRASSTTKTFKMGTSVADYMKAIQTNELIWRFVFDHIQQKSKAFSRKDFSCVRASQSVSQQVHHMNALSGNGSNIQ
jgi:hypothetical protein